MSFFERLKHPILKPKQKTPEEKFSSVNTKHEKERTLEDVLKDIAYWKKEIEKQEIRLERERPNDMALQGIIAWRKKQLENLRLEKEIKEEEARIATISDPIEKGIAQNQLNSKIGLLEVMREQR